MLSKYGFQTNERRSLLMSKIKSKNTKPEIILRKALWNMGYRYRIHSKKLLGKPDIVLKKYNLILFIDGEFWHGYNWKEKKKKIKSNKEYWIKKIESNINRDKKYNNKLKKDGWNIIRFWEHEIRNELEACIEKVVKYTKVFETTNKKLK